MITNCYERGRTCALIHYKLANSLGSTVGVAPRGEEWSHGTNFNSYPKRPSSTEPGDPVSSIIRKDRIDKEFDFADTMKNPGPGATGEYGQEVKG